MASDPLVGKVLADRFEILARIGEGGTGVVYKAKQITVDREIAIKVLGAHVSSDPQWVKRFHNEARAAARLHDPHTVQLIDFGQTQEGLLFIAMELLQGRSLREELDKLGKLPVDRALRIVPQACASLGEAHAQGIIHRDIKPDNLYLDATKGAGDFVRVLDFSVAKMENADAQQTRAGIVFGTPAYMSPEQGRGAKLGPQSDIYALGIVLYEMLNGKPPFDSKIPTEVVMMHLRDKPQPLQGVPEPLNALVMRALAKDPAQRQQSCDELADACEQLLLELYPQRTPSGMKAFGGGRPTTGPMRPLSTSAPSPQSRPATGPQAVAPPPPSPGAPQFQAPPRPAAAPPTSQPPSHPVAEQRTMIGAAPPPVAGSYGAPAASRGTPPPAWPSPPPASGQATVALQAPDSGAPAGAGTMILPDSQGVVAFALQQAEAARMAAAQPQLEPLKPAHWSFWVAWVVLGIGGGLAYHLWQAHRILAGGG